jgi:hypothetical protein
VPVFDKALAAQHGMNVPSADRASASSHHGSVQILDEAVFSLGRTFVLAGRLVMSKQILNARFFRATFA